MREMMEQSCRGQVKDVERPDEVQLVTTLLGDGPQKEEVSREVMT